MPLLLIRTNVKRNDIPKKIFTELTDLLVETLDRPKPAYCIIIQDDQYMSFGGTTDPCAACIIQDFEHFDVEENKRVSAVVMGYLFEALKVDRKRMYLEFAGVTKENIGFGGTTFHQFFGSTANGYNPKSQPDKNFVWPKGS